MILASALASSQCIFLLLLPGIICFLALAPFDLKMYIQEKLAVLDFVDGNVGEGEPMKPLPIEDTPFKLVEEVRDLKELAAKLRVVDEFAVSTLSQN